jgi:hydrogenase maturation protease
VTRQERAVLVLGVGCADRGDDGVGCAVARQVAALGLPGVRVVAEAQPLDLLDDGTAADLLVVVDAVRTGRAPGTVLVREIGCGALPDWAGAPSTHAIGLDAVVELARALGRMPRRLVLVGVEAAGFQTGEPLSPGVLDAVTAAAEMIAGLVGAAAGEP